MGFDPMAISSVFQSSSDQATAPGIVEIFGSTISNSYSFPMAQRLRESVSRVKKKKKKKKKKEIMSFSGYRLATRKHLDYSILQVTLWKAFFFPTVASLYPDIRRDPRIYDTVCT